MLSREVIDIFNYFEIVSFKSVYLQNGLTDLNEVRTQVTFDFKWKQYVLYGFYMGYYLVTKRKLWLHHGSCPPCLIRLNFFAFAYIWWAFHRQKITRIVFFVLIKKSLVCVYWKYDSKNLDVVNASKAVDPCYLTYYFEIHYSCPHYRETYHWFLLERIVQKLHQLNTQVQK